LEQQVQPQSLENLAEVITNIPHLKHLLNLVKLLKQFFYVVIYSLELRQEINAGLNVVENWNGANDFIYYGKSGEIASNTREDQEISMLYLHLLQVCITYVNTLLIQDILKEKSLYALLKEEDFRALTSLFYQHINPYGTFDLDLTRRLAIPL
jgi:TnpA family transposase